MRGSEFEQAMNDDELIESFHNIVCLESCDSSYLIVLRDHVRELMFRDLLSYATLSQ